MKRFLSNSPFLKWLLGRENVYALLLCLIALLLLIVSSDAAPQWIYQGF